MILYFPVEYSKYIMGTIMFYKINILLLAFICLIQIEKTFAQNNTRYAMGIAALQRKDTTAAEKYFKESVINNRDAVSFNALGKLQLYRNTFQSRNEALENLKQAALREPGNYEYRMAYAVLLEEFANKSAYQEYESLSALFPGKTDPYMQMGKLRLKQYMEFKFSKMLGQMDVDLRSGEEPVDLDLAEAVKDDSIEAVKLFSKVLDLDKNNVDAVISLGKLYEHSRDYKKAVEYCRKTMQIDTKNKDAHLLWGIIYNRTGDLKKANEEFKKAIELMSDNEKEDFVYNSILKVIPPKYISGEKFKSKKELEDFIARYWRMSNPQESAGYNQTLIEHYSRVAYANLHFSVPKYNIVGWKTERGEVYLRYGTPNSVLRYRPMATTTGAHIPKNDIWSFDGFRLSFDDYNITGNSKLTWDRGDNRRFMSNPRSNIFSFEIFENIKSRISSVYKPKGNMFTVPTRFYSFKNDKEGSKPEYYLIYPMPLQIKEGKLNLIDASWDYGFFVYDDSLYPVFEKTGIIDRETVLKLTKEPKNKEMISNIKISIPSSASTFKFQITRHSDSSFYTYTLPFKVKQYSENHLDLSDVVLASAINEGEEITGAIKRKEMYIVPSVNMTFRQNEPVNLYYEVYSLVLGKDNSAYFEQIITIEKSDGTGVQGEYLLEAIWNGIKKVFNGNKEKVSLSSSYETKETDTQQYLQVDFSKYPIGQYKVTLTVQDKISSSKVEKEFGINIIAGEKK